MERTEITVFKFQAFLLSLLFCFLLGREGGSWCLALVFFFFFNHRLE